MKISQLKHAILILSVAVLGGCATQKKTTVKKTKPVVTQQKPIAKPAEKPKTEKPKAVKQYQLPSVNREFRAAWIATVANINWPSKGNYNTELQKAEAIRILDMLKEANFNAVVFQARPSGDALYQSSLEPWSYFLTGQIGKSPSPFYDPLEFWISEAHKRGMELHVWLNPYRAHHSSGGAVTSKSIVHQMPESIHRLKNGMYWMDPSDQQVQNHTSRVIKDLVKRYDIDAIHIDDYFYPYRDYNGGKDFPDAKTWKAYQNEGGTLSRADWRRTNVNKFIKRIHDEIKAEKPFVKFGISPFGIWKPGYPKGITGSSQYDELFADAKLWLNEGWCDYFAPQLYWKEGGVQSFSALLKWWNDENYKNIHLWAGLNTIGVKSSDRPAEIVGQIRTTRSLLGNKAGEIHYSMDGISKSPAMLSALKDVYKEKALVPVSPWLKAEAIVKPELTARKVGNNLETKWLSRNEKQVRAWILYAKYGNQWETEILTAKEQNKLLSMQKNGRNLTDVAIKAVDRLGNESDYDAVEVQ